MKEEWKTVDGFENYQISNLGKVKSLCYGREKIMKKCIDTYGYEYVIFCKNGTRKPMLVHRLVAKAFIDNPLEKPQVNHLSGVKTDNAVSNLEWCTASENLKHAYDHLNKPRNGIKKCKVLETGKCYDSLRECADDINVDYSYVWRVVTGNLKGKACKGFHVMKLD